MTLKGSCLCSAVQFEVSGNCNGFYLCHCSRCRKDTGSAHGANLFFSEACLTWLAGEHLAHVFSLPKTRHKKCFCSNCGSALPYLDNEEETTVVPAGSLDDKIELTPLAHIFAKEKPPWDTTTDRIVSFEELPG